VIGWWRRLGHARRIFILGLLAGLPGVAISVALLWVGDFSATARWSVTATLVVIWLVAAVALREQVARPLRTLANMLAALREGDFSIRARVTDPSDPLALTHLELNALEDVLRNQRLGAVEATEALRKVLEEIDVAVFAFDQENALRLVNRAGERLLGQPGDRLLGRAASDLGIGEALTGPAPRTMDVSLPSATGRWELRRSVVRQEGQPWQLVTLSDLRRALREEEREAWRRIIRVLSHEINNSLAPIKSIAASLRSMLARETIESLADDVAGGLEVISGRAEALGRFMAAYAKLARLPRPELSAVDVSALIRRVADLETRVGVEVVPGRNLQILADPDQLEQALINLVGNAADAVVDTSGGAAVRLGWTTREGYLHILIEDDGPGLAESGNLFVPFYTTKPGGSGIGLVLSRQIAEGHGGTLELENRRDGTGARASFVVPIGDVAAAALVSE